MQARDIINRACRLTGTGQIECSVSVLTDDNHIMMLEFLNQFKDRIENAHNWRALRQTANMTISAGETSGTIINAPKSSRLVRIHDARFGQLIPLAFDVTDVNQPYPLKEMDLPLLIYKNTMNVTNTGDQRPVAFSLDTSGAGTDLRVQVYPKATTARNLQLTLIVPQQYIDVGDIALEISIPSRALVIGITWYILQERGEELGQGSMFTEEQFRIALDDEIGMDNADQGDLELVPV